MRRIPALSGATKFNTELAGDADLHSNQERQNAAHSRCFATENDPVPDLQSQWPSITDQPALTKAEAACESPFRPQEFPSGDPCHAGERFQWRLTWPTILGRFKLGRVQQSQTTSGRYCRPKEKRDLHSGVFRRPAIFFCDCHSDSVVAARKVLLNWQQAHALRRRTKTLSGRCFPASDRQGALLRSRRRVDRTSAKCVGLPRHGGRLQLQPTLGIRKG